MYMKAMKHPRTPTNQTTSTIIVSEAPSVLCIPQPPCLYSVTCWTYRSLTFFF